MGSYRQKSTPLKSVLHTIAIPEEQLRQDQPVLLTEVSYNGQTQYLSVKLPGTGPKGIAVRFFPEGGYLVEGQPSVVGWEAKTADGRPLSVSGILYEDKEPIDTLVGNSYGTGSFSLRPNKDKEYTFRITKNDFLNQDTLYALPSAIDNGIVLRLKNAVVNDTLKMELYSNASRKVQVLIHNYREGFASFSLQATPEGASATIALPSLPKGIATVTVLDEDGRPLAERLFFAHYDRGTVATFHLDKARYDKKEKARVKLKVTDQDNRPVQGIVSIAAVQKNRLEVEKRKDIETYVFMERELGDLPIDPLGMGYGNREYLEDMLLVKGWRRYTWQGLMAASKETGQVQSRSPQIKGQVFMEGKVLKKPVEVSVVRDTLFNLVTTDSIGSFILERDDLLSEPDKKVLLSVNEKNKAGYTIQVESPYESVNVKLAESAIFSLQGNQDIQSSGNQQMGGLENAIALNAVTVTGKRDESLYGLKARGSNECGDYVDNQGFLNHPRSFNNSDNRKPVEGHSYFDGLRKKKFTHEGGSYEIVRYDEPVVFYDNILIIYQGCIISKEVFQIPGIYLDREFYGVSLEEEYLSEPQYLSTLFWQPGILLDENGEADFSFLTGDIAGDFNIVVQGVGEGDVISETEKFIVN